MALRKIMTEGMVVSGKRDDWMKRGSVALESSGFIKVTVNPVFYQIEANFRELTVSGSIQITLVYSGGDTKLTVVSTANMDNIYALLKSPNKIIMSKFKEGLTKLF